MSLGRFLMVFGSILAFGFMCFIGGIEFKAGNKGIAMYMAVIGVVLLNTAFDIINAPNPTDESDKTKKRRKI